jgi:alpha-1,3-rhamnosyl/mannosyltransferase
MILTVSDAMRREILAHFKLPEERVRAIPLAASGLFRPINRPTTATELPKPAKPYFLFIGTLEPRKNLPALVEAWRETRAQTGADLFIAGRTRDDFVPIPPAEGIQFLGEVPDDQLPTLLSGALAFVYPTSYEGFGLPVLEAMQCGCPVITSRDPAVTEVSGGAAIHAASVREMADALRCLLRATFFSWQRTAHETRDLYREVLAGARS